MTSRPSRRACKVKVSKGGRKKPNLTAKGTPISNTRTATTPVPILMTNLFVATQVVKSLHYGTAVIFCIETLVLQLFNSSTCISQNAQPLALLTSLSNNNNNNNKYAIRIHHSWHAHRWLMRTSLSIPIDGIVSFSWNRIAETTSPIQLAWVQK